MCMLIIIEVILDVELPLPARIDRIQEIEVSVYCVVKQVLLIPCNESVSCLLLNASEKVQTVHCSVDCNPVRIGSKAVLHNAYVEIQSEPIVQGIPVHIDGLLSSRAEAAKIRRAGGRLKGPAKRTAAQNEAFIAAFHEMIQEAYEDAKAAKDADGGAPSQPQ